MTNKKISELTNVSSLDGSEEFPVVQGGVTKAATISKIKVTDAMLRNSAALSVLGRASNSAGTPADIEAAADGQVLRRSGTSVGFGTVATAGLADDAVDDTKLRNSAALSVIGRASNSSGNPADISASSNDTLLRRTGDALSFGQTTEGMFADNTVPDTAFKYKRTPAETTAGVTPVNLRYPELHAFRYMTSAQQADVLAYTYGEDVTTALQNALLVSAQAQMPVTLPAGGYLVSDTLELDDYTGFVGAGREVTILKLDDSSNVDVIQTRDFSSFESNANFAQLPTGTVLLDFSIDGNSANNTSGSGISSHGIARNYRRLNIFECAEYGLYSNGTPTAGTNYPASTELGGMREDTITDVHARRCGLSGIRYKGPNDIWLDNIICSINGLSDLTEGYGFHNEAVINIGKIHCYANHKANFFNESTVRAHMLEARDGQREGFVSQTGGGSQIAKLYCDNNSRETAGTYDTIKLISGRGTIGQLYAGTNNGGVGVHAVDGQWECGPARIAGFESGGIGLHVETQAGFSIGPADITDFSDTGGIGIKTEDVVNTFIRARITGCETGWSKSGTGSGIQGNHFDITLKVNATMTTIFTGDDIDPADVANVVSQGTGVLLYSSSHVLSSNFDVTSTGSTSQTLSHKLLHSPPAENIQLTFVPPDTSGTDVAATDWAATAQVVSVTDTQITIRVNVTTASGTANAATRVAIASRLGR